MSSDLEFTLRRIDQLAREGREIYRQAYYSALASLTPAERAEVDRILEREIR